MDSNEEWPLTEDAFMLPGNFAKMQALSFCVLSMEAALGISINSAFARLNVNIA